MEILLRTMHEYGQLEKIVPSDLLALQGLLVTLLDIPRLLNGTVKLLMDLRDSCQDGARGQAVQTILIQTLQQLAVCTDCASFGNLMIKAETKAKEEHQWVENFGYQPDISIKRISANFEKIVSTNRSDGAVTCLPSREDMLNVLKEHSKFEPALLLKDVMAPSVTGTTSGRSDF
jgi:hypothetical protein